MPVPRRGRSQSRATRLTKRWIGWSTGTGFLAQTAGVIAIVVAAPSTFLDTILRTRGSLIASIDGASAPPKLVDVGLGMILLQEGSVAAGVVVSPLTDPNADWFWYSRFTLGYEEMVTDVIDVPTLSGYRETIDSKAMRKGPPDTEVACVFEQATIGGGSSVNLVASGRFLVGQ